MLKVRWLRRWTAQGAVGCLILVLQRQQEVANHEHEVRHEGSR